MTEPRTRAPRVSARSAAVFIATTAFLSINFYTNDFRVASVDLFNREITESFVMGRLNKSAQDGIFSSSGLLGHGGPDAVPPVYSTPTMDLQYESYLEARPFRSFVTYNSQIGGQAMVLAVVDRVLPGTPAERLEVHRVMASVLAAAAFGLIVVWFWLELGAVAGLFAFASLASASWLLAFAHNLFWSLWSFYLPMIALMYHMGRTGGVRWDQRLTLLIFGTVLLKCVLNGYEFITTTLIMMTVPFVYYRVREADPWTRVFGDLTKAAVMATLAVGVSLVPLMFQIGALTDGGLGEGIAYVLERFRERTYSDPIGDAGGGTMLGMTVGLLGTYVTGTFFSLNTYVYSENSFLTEYVFNVRYIYLFVAFAIATFIALRAARPDGSRQLRALAVATWFSALAPLSWFVLFVNHSYHHTHMNFIVWQMPFTIFGFALCGLALRQLVISLGTRRI